MKAAVETYSRLNVPPGRNGSTLSDGISLDSQSAGISPAATLEEIGGLGLPSRPP